MKSCKWSSPGSAGHDVVDVWFLEAVEGGGGSHGVGAHVVKDQPVAHLQVRQVTLLHDAVKAVACRAPDTAGVHGLIRLWLLLVQRQGRHTNRYPLIHLPLSYLAE